MVVFFCLLMLIREKWCLGVIMGFECFVFLFVFGVWKIYCLGCLLVLN